MVDAFSLPGSRPLGCLLVHGFTGTPEEMRPLGEALAARGFPVYGVRLAGHGTDVAEPARTRWTDWFASVEAGGARPRASAERTAARASAPRPPRSQRAVGQPRAAAARPGVAVDRDRRARA